MSPRSFHAARPSRVAGAFLFAILSLSGCGSSSSDSDSDGDGGGSGSGGAAGGDEPIVNFSLPAYVNQETDGEIRIPVVLTSTSGTDITVPFQVGGTASSSAPDADYLLPGGSSVTIPAGASTADIVLVPVDDGLDESDETIFIQLGIPSLGSLGLLSQATVTLQDSGGSGAPFGEFLLLGASVGSPLDMQVHTADDSDGTALRISPAELSVASASLAPGGQHLAFEGAIPLSVDRGVFVLDAFGGDPFRLSGELVQGLGPAVWSPDGQSVAFAEAQPSSPAAGVVLVGPGGEERTLLEFDGFQILVPSDEPYRWSPDSTRIALLGSAIDTGEQRLLIGSRNGLFQAVLQAGIPQEDSVGPGFEWSPDGQWLSFSAGSSLYLGNADTGVVERIATADVPSWAGSHKFEESWNPSTNLLGYRFFDEATEQVSLVSVQVPGLAEVPLSTIEGNVGVEWAWSPTGTCAGYLLWSQVEGASGLRVVEADGTGDRQVSEDKAVQDFRWSPGGERLAFRASQGMAGLSAVYSAQLDGSQVSQLSLTFEEDVADRASYRWSPDGLRVSYATAAGAAADSISLVSEVWQGGDRRVHLGPLAASSRVLEHRWSADSDRLSVHLEVLEGSFLASGLRTISAVDPMDIVNPTGNLYGGEGLVIEYFVR